jgi:nitroreductase
MIPEESKLKVIEYAARAPSKHNTQPWKFQIAADTIALFPDFSRSLAVTDSDNHALYISLGCALENLIIAANEFNYLAKPDTGTNENGLFVRVLLYEGGKIEKSGLFDYIVKQQVTRSKYNPRRIPYGILRELSGDTQGEGVHLRLFLNETEIRSLIPYIINGNKQQSGNRLYVKELVTWFRFSEKEAKLKGDGLWSASFGLTAMGRFIGPVCMKMPVSSVRESRRPTELILTSSGLVMFLVEKNNPVHWVRLGQCFQRFGLKAAKYHISYAHLNMPHEVLKVREAIIHDFQLFGLIPLLLILMGFSDPMPYSFRRNLNDLLII